MGNTIRHKRSSTSGSSPSVSDLSLGEICINTYDGKLFVKKDDGSASIVEIGASSSTTIAASPPASPDSGDIYWDTEDTTPYIYYDDGTTSQWVALVNTASYSTSLTYDSSSRVLSSSTGSGITFPEVVGGGISGLLAGSDKTKLDAFTVDSSGNVGVGSSTINQTTSGRTVLGINGTNNALLNFNHSNTIAGFIYGANDEFRVAAEGSRPLMFHTNSTERMRILSSGGLTFNGDTAQANALDDYEEGTFVPVLRGTSAAGTYVANRASSGRYIKIGRFVHLTVDFNNGSFSGSTGTIEIANLPFVVSNDGNTPNGDVPYENHAIGMSYNVAFNHDERQHFYLNPGQTTASGIRSRNNTSWVDMASSTFHSSSLYFSQTLSYVTT